MNIYKDINRMLYVYELENGEKYELYWSSLCRMSANEKALLEAGVNAKLFLNKYGKKI